MSDLDKQILEKLDEISNSLKEISVLTKTILNHPALKPKDDCASKEKQLLKD
jgi:hypothetical protein